ncbi:MAG: GTP cyclohydrolase [Bacteroidota bacterium]
MKPFEYFQRFSLLALVAILTLVTACGDDDDAPEPVNEPEVITDVKLIFTNVDDANDVVEASAQDPDGDGVEELMIMGPINLGVNKTYTLTYEIFNNLEMPGEDIGEEIAEEDDEHQFFYSFTEGAFANPTGNGNVDTASDPINYVDFDRNMNPLGLETTWTTAATPTMNGQFTARLQHQPDEKTATSGADVGESDFDLEFVLNIQ